MARKVLTALLLLCATAIAAEKPSYYNAVVRVDGCSGVLIRKGKDISVGVSAQHCTGAVGTVARFLNPDGTGGYARWIAEDADSDLSLFRVWTKDTKGVTVSVQSNLEKPDEKYDGWGYPKGKGPEWKRLEWEGTYNIDGLKNPRHQFRVRDGIFNNGDSGGGVFSRGKLFGITSHGSKGHKYLFSCTKEQLNSFLRKEADKLDTKLVQWDGNKAPPLGSDRDRTVALAAVIKKLAEMEAENKKLREEVRRIVNTPVRVQVLDPRSGKVLAEEAYPFGTPIKLVLPELRK
jgi:hypothetical protein